MTIDVDALRTHLNITGTDDDAVLARLLSAAASHVEAQLGFAVDDADEFPEGTPADVDQAVLMLAAHWYENREGSIVGMSIASVPYGVAEVLANRRRYSFAAEDT